MSHSRRLSARDKGFTLIELLIAVAIGAIVLTALYATFFSVFRAGSVAEEKLDEHIRAGRFTDLFSRDIHGAYLGRKPRTTEFTGAPLGMGSALSFASFTYPVLKKGFPASDLAGVSYFSEESSGGGVTDGGVNVYREAWNPYIGEKVRVEVLKGVRSFEIEYYNGSLWSKAWDSGLENALPEAVRATVKLPGGMEFKALATTMVKAGK